MFYKVPFLIQFASFILPDMKVQNAIHWTLFWLNLAKWILSLAI